MDKQKKLRLRTATAVLAAIAIGASAPTAALAQDTLDDPTAAQYDEGKGTVDGAVGGVQDPGGTGGDPGGGAAGGGATSGDRAIGGLPFTGLDLGVLAVTAVLLGLSGLVLRRLAPPSRGDG